MSDFWFCRFFLHWWILHFLVHSNLKLRECELKSWWNCAVLPKVKLLLSACGQNSPSPSSSSRTTFPRAMPTFLAFHCISWVSPISSDLATKCLPDLLSGKNSCYSWHIQMPVQILGSLLWGVHFIFLQQWRSISLIRRKTMELQNITGDTSGS